MKFTIKAQDISNQATSLINFHNRFVKFFQQTNKSYYLFITLCYNQRKWWFL